VSGEPSLAELEHRERVRKVVHDALADCCLLPSYIEQHQAARTIERLGEELFSRWFVAAPDATRRRLWQQACRSMHLPLETVHRIVGFGAWQTAQLATATPDDARSLGALFNLGIVLFDSLLDRGGASARAVEGAFNETVLRDLSLPQHLLSERTGDEAVRFFATVVGEFFAGLRAMPQKCQRTVAAMLPAMFAAEVTSAQPSSLGRRELWRALAIKSRWPFRVLTCIGALGRADADLATAARAFGTAVWIVDDLWDVAEDWRNRSASRACLLLRATGAGDADDVRHALDATITAGVLARENRRLRRAFAAIAPHHSAAKGLGVTLSAWVGIRAQALR
jgi:hypothetical protein